MLAKFKQNRMTQNTQIFGAFDKKPVYHDNHFWRSVGDILKEVSAFGTINDAKVFIIRLSSFIIPKIGVVWHVKPG